MRNGTSSTVALRLPPEHAAATDAAISFVLLAFFAIPAGWLLFVYLRRSFKTRATALALLAGGSLVVACLANVAFSPPLP